MLGAAATQMRPRCHSSRRRGTPSDRMQAAARLRRPIAHSARTGPRRAQCPAPAHRRSRREAPLRRGSRDKWTSSYSTSRQRAVVVRSPSSPDRSGATHARTECGGWVFGLRCCSSARELASAPAPADARSGRAASVRRRAIGALTGRIHANAGADQERESARLRVSVPIECQNSNEKRANRRQTPARRRRRCARYAGIKRQERTIRVCLPCRRSRVRVPSAAWKYLQIDDFLISWLVD
jgi:hypothetical protein